MRTSGTLLAIAVIGIVSSARIAAAESLRDAIVPPRARGSQVIEAAIRPLGSVIGTQVANQIPTFSTSAGFTYEFNSELDVYERSAKTFGPLFGERAVTLGKGKFNITNSYTWVKFDEFNGRSLHNLDSRSELARLPDQNGSFYFGVVGPSGLTQLKLDLDLEAQLVDFSFTYGVLDNLDVNIDVPVLRTYVRSGLIDVIPDPRCARLGLQLCQPFDDTDLTPGGFATLPESADSKSSIGVGDIRLRSKYLVIRKPVALAGLVDLVLPSGNTDNFQGTGDTRLGTMLIASDEVLDFLELHAQGGVEFNIDTIDRSQARYVAGFTAQVTSFAALTTDFLGRSEFGAQGRIPSSGRLPTVHNGTFVNTQAELQDPNTRFGGRGYFLDIHRNDILDLAVGAKFALGERAILFATALIPLNQDGLRANFVPTLGFEVNL